MKTNAHNFAHTATMGTVGQALRLPRQSGRPLQDVVCSALLVCAWLTVPAVSEAQTFVSRPVGVLKFEVNAGESKPLSLPVSENYVYAGAVTTAAATSITTTGAAWDANAYGPLASKPHLVRFTTGGAAGRHFRIISHNADTLTIQTNGADLTSSVAAGDRYEIVPADTLARLFGNDASTAGVNVNSNSQLADNVMIRVTSGWLTFFNDGTSWYRAGTSTPQNNMVIPPESGFVFVRRGATPLTFTVGGQTPVINLVTDLPAGRTTLGANRFPVDTTLNALGLHNAAGWVKGANADAVDNVLIYAGGVWQTFYHDGTNWLLVGNATPQNPPIPAGSSIVIVKRAGSATTVIHPRPYAVD